MKNVKVSISKNKAKQYFLWSQVIDFDNMLLSYKKTQLGKPRLKLSAINYKENYILNLIELRNKITQYEYKPRGYISFIVEEPKVRLIYAPVYEDKIVQHMLNNVLRDLYEPLFIYDSYACIRNKGTHAAVLRIQKFQRLAYKNYEDPYFLKLDISKFFLFYRQRYFKTNLN